MTNKGYSISTRAKGWQNQCRKWARSRARFEVGEIQPEHFRFCREICTEFHYEFGHRFAALKGESIAYFVPEYHRLADVAESLLLANV